MATPSLSKEQEAIAIKVADAAIKYGINPELALAVAYQESKFDPAAKSKRGATGVMQIMPENAKTYKIDANDVDQNIDAGMRLLSELRKNPKIGNDPVKLLVGYNTRTATRNKFYESGNLEDLPEETQNYLVSIADHAGGELPTSVDYSATAPASDTNPPTPVVVPPSTTAAPTAGGSTPEAVAEASAADPVMAGAMGAAMVGNARTPRPASTPDMANMPTSLMRTALVNSGIRTAGDLVGRVPIPGTGIIQRLAHEYANGLMGAQYTRQGVDGAIIDDAHLGQPADPKDPYYGNKASDRELTQQLRAGQNAAMKNESTAALRASGLNPDAPLAAAPEMRVVNGVAIPISMQGPSSPLPTTGRVEPTMSPLSTVDPNAPTRTSAEAAARQAEVDRLAAAQAERLAPRVASETLARADASPAPVRAPRRPIRGALEATSNAMKASPGKTGAVMGAAFSLPDAINAFNSGDRAEAAKIIGMAGGTGALLAKYPVLAPFVAAYDSYGMARDGLQGKLSGGFGDYARGIGNATMMAAPFTGLLAPAVAGLGQVPNLMKYAYDLSKDSGLGGKIYDLTH
jgi:hypothetical protein